MDGSSELWWVPTLTSRRGLDAREHGAFLLEEVGERVRDDADPHRAPMIWRDDHERLDAGHHIGGDAYERGIVAPDEARERGDAEAGLHGAGHGLHAFAREDDILTPRIRR